MHGATCSRRRQVTTMTKTSPSEIGDDLVLVGAPNLFTLPEVNHVTRRPLHPGRCLGHTRACWLSGRRGSVARPSGARRNTHNVSSGKCAVRAAPSAPGLN